MNNILEVNKVVKKYGDYTALNEVSLSIPQGSIYGLLGPNGAGKTSLIRIINQITMPDSGEVLLDGKLLQPDDVQYIGYMPEERGLYKSMKVGEQCLYLAQLKGLSKEDAKIQLKYWFDRLEIQGWWNKKIQELSKGMAQKIQFVVTVLHKPKLLILDEPFSGFDPVNANLIKDEIFNLAKRGSTVIFSTHRMEQVEEICNNIVLVNKGQKILDGTIADIKNDFKENIYSLQADNLPAHVMSPLFDVVNQKQDGLLLKLKDNTKPNDILQHFINEKAAINSFNEVLPSLNEIFIKLVEGTAKARQFQKVD